MTETTRGATAAATLPDCLTRTAADDRAEAQRIAEGALARKGFDLRATDRFEKALTLVQREQSTAVVMAAGPADVGTSIGDLAEHASREAAFWIRMEAKLEPGGATTRAQRSRLLDAARVLTRLAIEVLAR